MQEEMKAKEGICTDLNKYFLRNSITMCSVLKKLKSVVRVVGEHMD